MKYNNIKFIFGNMFYIILCLINYVLCQTIPAGQTASINLSNIQEFEDKNYKLIDSGAIRIVTKRDNKVQVQNTQNTDIEVEV